MHTVLSQSAVLELAGPDALAFAQAQLMNDVQALDDGAWQWNGWLNPKGRLVAFFACIRRDAQTLLLWLPAGGAGELATRLQRYVFRSKVQFEPGRWQAVGSFGDPPQAAGALCLAMPPDDDGMPRHLLLVPGEAQFPTDPGLAVRWQCADLRHGVPYIGPGLPDSEQFVPQWLSLERLQAFSLRKGCYPGQEIVARMHFLGQSKRAAFLLDGPGDPPPMMTRVRAGDGSIGEIVSSAPAREGWLALAALVSAQVEPPLALEDGRPAALRPLAD